MRNRLNRNDPIFLNIPRYILRKTDEEEMIGLIVELLDY